jgi:tRNA modification GTPase
MEANSKPGSVSRENHFQPKKVLNKGLEEEVKDLKREVDTMQGDSFTKSELIKDGIRVAIIGGPNVGKRSLINHLHHRALSPVASPVTGTTRDSVRGPLDIQGYATRIFEPLALNQQRIPTNDGMRGEDILEAVKRAEGADLRVLVTDAPALVRDFGSNINMVIGQYKKLMDFSEEEAIFVINKIDLLSDPMKRLGIIKRMGCKKCVLLSCKTEEGLDRFEGLMAEEAKALCGDPAGQGQGQGLLFVNQRHRKHLLLMSSSLERVLASVSDPTVCAQHLREAQKQVSHIMTGEMASDGEATSRREALIANKGSGK